MAYTYEYPRPTVTTDIVLFAGNVDVYQSLQVLLIQRKNEPFQGMWAFPGGFVDMDEDLLTCALRELEEETGVKNVELVQLHTFGSVDRDPRHRTISVVYGGVIPNTLEAIAMDDADDALV